MVKKKTVKNIGALLIGILIAIIIGELALRLVAPQPVYNDCSYGHPDHISDTELNPNYGWFTRANLEQCYFAGDSNREIMMTHNSKGLRTENEFTYEKPEGTKRMLLFGDSFFYGLYVDDDETLAYHLQEKLPDWEIIPFGVSGYGTGQSLLVYLSEGIKYDPDVVVLGFYQNDFSNVHAGYQQEAFKPRFVIEEGELRVSNLPAPTNTESKFWFPTKEHQHSLTKRILLGNSHLYIFLSSRLSSFGNKIEPVDYASAYKDSEFYSIEKNWNPVMVESSQVVERLFIEFDRITEENGAEFLLLNIPSQYQVNPEKREQIFKQFSGVSETFFEYDKQNKWISEVAQRNDIMLLDTTDYSKEEYQDIFLKDGHWNLEGNKRAAEEIISKLEAEQVIE